MSFSNFTRKVIDRREEIWGTVARHAKPASTQTLDWIKGNPIDAIKLTLGVLLISEVDDLGDASASQCQPENHHNYHN